MESVIQQQVGMAFYLGLGGIRINPFYFHASMERCPLPMVKCGCYNLGSGP